MALRDRWIVRPRVRLVVPPGVPIWPTVKEERPWGLPAAFWNFATPWAWVRIYGHVGERTLYQLWWWSRRPAWAVNDWRTAADWWVQRKVKEAHEARIARSRAAR